MEVGSVSGSLVQNSQASSPRQVSRDEPEQRQQTLESPAQSSRVPEPNQRVGSLVDTTA